MKKSELKNIIKECVKEVIFEEGILSGIVTEVAQGLVSKTIQEGSPVRSQTKPQRPHHDPRANNSEHAKRKVLAAVAQNSYEEVKKKFSNPELFEGTMPIQGGDSKGALSGVPSGDSGVDISNIPGFGNWSSVANKTK
jgi:hypothetical protein